MARLLRGFIGAIEKVFLGGRHGRMRFAMESDEVIPDLDPETREAAWLWWSLQPKGTPPPECIREEVEKERPQRKPPSSSWGRHRIEAGRGGGVVVLIQQPIGGLR